MNPILYACIWIVVGVALLAATEALIALAARDGHVTKHADSQQLADWLLGADEE